MMYSPYTSGINDTKAGLSLFSNKETQDTLRLLKHALEFSFAEIVITDLP